MNHLVVLLVVGGFSILSFFLTYELGARSKDTERGRRRFFFRQSRQALLEWIAPHQMEGPKAAGVLAATTSTVASVLIAKKMFLGRTKEDSKTQLPRFLELPKHAAIVQVIRENLDALSGDSLVKITRQLEFWIKEETREDELLDLAKRLCHAASWQSRAGALKVPKVRFGRTEVQIPIVTCGTMRFQHTWMPDFTPLTINKKKVVTTPSQVNLEEVVRQCLRMGINHFETARMYGTSEIQLVHALSSMVESGEIKRSDFILQTKIPVRPKTEWVKAFEQSWAHFQVLGHIDFLSFWCVSKDDQVELALDEGADSLMSITLQWKKEGKIKHIGFSTHGSAENIMRLIESNKFDYVNLHYHYFGSYHAEGTPDTQGGHGNLACVKRALELDMGVFNISPIDKGGRLYQPSSQVARLIGTEMTPIAFANLYSWLTAGMHTVSVGFARPEDLTETLEAVEMFIHQEKYRPILKSTIERLNNHAKKYLGEDWFHKGLLNVPSPLAPESNGIGLGHALWCSNMLHAFGMYETAKSRYSKLVSEGKKWKTGKTYEENMKAIGGGNPMRAPDDSITYEKVLSKHFDTKLAADKIQEVGVLLGTPIKGRERQERGWDEAYDLRPWHEFPDSDRLSIPGVIMQNVSGGFFGSGGGPTQATIDMGDKIRRSISASVEAS